ncbi:OLC1v1021532C7 [Oldenlandia corymbosa var. corymbosa]|uniref:OLC1v1021532C7 n=1 Tax=Oldenlandia corymbosa var. corymbosa TaxID=529605 RepID=A0AAV1BYE4_OLDCO|nr:OLC1v1021532C7 [Oldenlandia corymbosa var. corymbosa]
MESLRMGCVVCWIITFLFVSHLDHKHVCIAMKIPTKGNSNLEPSVITCICIGLNPVQLTDLQHSDVEMSEKQEALEDDDEDDGPPPGWDLVPPTSQGADAVPSGSTRILLMSDREIGSHQEGARDNNERTKQGHEIVPPSPMLPSTTCSLKAQASLPQEKGQMICGSCRKLLTYPRGVKYVRCSCCQTVNLVLEAHQVGQVKCGGCAVLLMYPEGAPSVKCCSCRYVTDIGVCTPFTFLC